MLSLNPLYQFVIVNASPYIFPLLLLVAFLFELFLKQEGNLNKLLSKYQSFFISLFCLYEESSVQLLKKDQEIEISSQLRSPSEEREDGFLRREDLETVMGRLGIFCHPGGGKHQERLGSDDLSNLFEEKEPSLGEVKEAFDVFDENRDGFIDAAELQRVLCALRLKEGVEIENCRRMIGAVDHNGDGRIDFGEFVKFMEEAFC